MKRMIFALIKCWIYAPLLYDFLKNSHKKINSLNELTLKRLDDAHVAVVALDFDGVLAPHGSTEPLPEVATWLRKLANNIGEQRIVILTNKPLPSRIEYFRQNFPGIELIQGARKKPYPDGLYTIALQKGIPIYRLMLVDDRLLTGMLAIIIAKSQGCYFAKPYKNFRKRPIVETFFVCLRVGEVALVKLLNFLKG